MLTLVVAFASPITDSLVTLILLPIVPLLATISETLRNGAFEAGSRARNEKAKTSMQYLFATK